MEVRMIHPLKGEPLTVLVMPNIIVSEHMFDVNDLGTSFRCKVWICQGANYPLMYIGRNKVFH